MVVHFASDLHLEMGPIDPSTVPKGDLLLLAGDIFLPWHEDRDKISRNFKDFFDTCSENFDKVLMVAGNHEHYGGFFFETNEKVAKYLSVWKNIFVLENNTVRFDTFNVFGATFWTDNKRDDPQVAWDIHRNLSDYSVIQLTSDYIPGKSNKLRTTDTSNEHYYSVRELEKFVAECVNEGKIPLIMTHHNPSWICTDEEYRLDTISYAYSCTDIDSTTLDFPRYIWICGHSHTNLDVEFGSGRILRNPRGYVGYETKPNNFSFKELKL